MKLVYTLLALMVALGALVFATGCFPDTWCIPDNPFEPEDLYKLEQAYDVLYMNASPDQKTELRKFLKDVEQCATANNDSTLLSAIQRAKTKHILSE